jgi:hypothetical protein
VKDPNPSRSGAALSANDFVIGMEQFGQPIQPPMKSRAQALAA